MVVRHTDACQTNSGIIKHKPPPKDPIAAARIREAMDEARRILREAGALAAKNRAETKKLAIKQEANVAIKQETDKVAIKEETQSKAFARAQEVAAETKSEPAQM